MQLGRCLAADLLRSPVVAGRRVTRPGRENLTPLAALGGLLKRQLEEPVGGAGGGEGAEVLLMQRHPPGVQESDRRTSESAAYRHRHVSAGSSWTRSARLPIFDPALQLKLQSVVRQSGLLVEPAAGHG